MEKKEVKFYCIDPECAMVCPNKAHHAFVFLSIFMPIVLIAGIALKYLKIKEGL